MRKAKGKRKYPSEDELRGRSRPLVYIPGKTHWTYHPEYVSCEPHYRFNGVFDQTGKKLQQEEVERHKETIARRGTQTHNPYLKGETNMTISINVSDSGGGDREYKVVPAGPHNAVCTLIADLGLQETPYGDKHKVYLRFEVPGQRLEFEKDGESFNVPMSIGGTYTLSLNERANLRKILEAWRGKAFTKDELDGFELTNLLGKPALLIVTNKVDGEGKTRAYIDTATRATEAVTAENEPRAFGPASTDLGDAPNWIQEAISKGAQRAISDEVAAAVSEPDVPATADDDIPF